VEVVDWSRHATEAQLHGEPPLPAPTRGGIFNSAIQLDSREHGGPLVNLLTRDQSVTWFFKTREGAMGVLQLVSFTNDPPSVKIHYKLLQQTNGQDNAVSVEAGNTHATLAQRFEAASMMNDMGSRDKLMAALVVGAANAGEVKIVKESLQQITDFGMRCRVANEAVRSLAKRGLKKQALEIAKNIDDVATRDQALSELAK
jgi:hypothetical protein